MNILIIFKSKSAKVLSIVILLLVINMPHQLSASVTSLENVIAASFSINSYGDQGTVENLAYTSPAASISGSPVGTLTYSLSGPDAALFTIDSSTGQVSMVARDFENPLDDDGNNLYSVIVRATDTAADTAERFLDVVIFNDCSDNDDSSIFKLSSPDSLGDINGNDASLQIKLLGTGGMPLSGVAVTFVRTSGDATISNPNGFTGSDGIYTSVVTGNSVGTSLFTAMYDSTGDDIPDTMVTLGSPTGIQITSDVSNFAIDGMVGIGTENPDPSSVLEVAGTEKGVLIPRISLISATDTTTISSPAISLLVYNTTNSATLNIGFVFWDGSEWKSVCAR